MPSYDYACENGHQVELQRRIADRDNQLICGECLSDTEESVEMARDTAVSPLIHDGQGITGRKPDGEFRAMMKEKLDKYPRRSTGQWI